MKFGKTRAEKYAEEQANLEYRYKNPKTWFAWYPVQIDTGEWVWWEHVKVIEPINDYGAEGITTGYHYHSSLSNTYKRIKNDD